MPNPSSGSKKAELKAKQKLIEDKTFGLKNKNKSKKVQKEVSRIETQVLYGNGKKTKGITASQQTAINKKLKEERQKEIATLFKPVVDKKNKQLEELGVDPKSILCSFFKAGSCAKGTKCKYSHDLNVERKMHKANLWTDLRENEPTTTTSGMDTWDQNTLEIVVKTHRKRQKNSSKIVCKHFLDALNKKLYGWFWVCPNGGDMCHYRHALPKGYVLKEKNVTNKEDESISLEEFLELERTKLKEEGTLVTEETFMKWRENRTKKEQRKKQKDSHKRLEEAKLGKLQLSGLELISVDPDSFVDDIDAQDIDYLNMMKENDAMNQTNDEHEENSDKIDCVDESLFQELNNLKLEDNID